MNILLVEDDLQLGKALCRGLELAGFNPCWVRLLADAKLQLTSRNFDLMLLDLGLPDGDGHDGRNDPNNNSHGKKSNG